MDAGRARLRGDAATARQALVALPPWGKAEARTFVLLLAIVPAVFVFPYKNLGAQDAQGNRFYRAYFTADFIWHTALTAELMKYDMPPINPYLGDRTIRYYWTYSWFLPLSQRKDLQGSGTSNWFSRSTHCPRACCFSPR